MNLAEQYIEGVLSKEVLTGRLVQLSIQRHLDDIEKSKDENYPYYFDEAAGLRAIEIAKKHKHTKGSLARKPFDLQPFQAFILYCIFGWKRKSNGYRRFTTAYVETGKKSGKSEFAAIIANIGLLFDDEFGAEVYTAATKRDQAKIVFDRSKWMLKQLATESKKMGSKIRILTHNISIPSTNSKMEALAKDGKSMDGLFPHIAIIDEYHAHPNDEVVDNIESGMGGRSQPLLFIITTAGFNIDGPCYELREVCVDVLEGRLEDDAMFCIIYALDEGDDWKDQSVWGKPNPNLGITPTWDFMRDKFKAAINKGAAKEVNFKTKNLNIWTPTSVTWISDDIWKSCGSDWSLDILKGRDAYGGLDLGSVSDLTAFTLFFPATSSDPKARTIHMFWIPDNNIDQKSKDQRVNYRQWIRDNYVNVTPGNATDYKFVRKDLNEFASIYRIRAVAYDRWNQLSIIPDLMDDGMNLMKYGQGFQSMNAPLKYLEKMCLDGQIDHGNNKVMRWMMSNVLLKLDPAGNIKIDKAKSKKKVDGPVSLAMAIGAWQRTMEENQKEQSIYNRKEPLVL